MSCWRRSASVSRRTARLAVGRCRERSHKFIIGPFVVLCEQIISHLLDKAAFARFAFSRLASAGVPGNG